MMHIEKRVGNLAEIRFRPPLTNDDLTNFTMAVREIVRVAAEPVVFITDWREVVQFSEDMVHTFVWIMRRDNPNVRCNAVLAQPDHPAAVEQCTRILREAANPNRRLFTNAASAEAYLGPQLTPAEQRRLTAFLAER